MIAAAVVTSLFVMVVAITWLSARAEAAQTRCDDLAQHIRHQLEIRPAEPGAPRRRRTGLRR